MNKLILFLYMITFSILSNCFIVFEGIVPLVCSAVLFVVLNFIAGLISAGTQSIRLRVLNHGTIILLSFCASVLVSVCLHILVFCQVIPLEKDMLIHSIIYCVLCNVLLFFNGIICTYLTSVQIGIKLRVIGIICGFIPIANLIVLSIIIKKAYLEFEAESNKERINKQRKYNKICQTKYPILFVHGVFFRDNKYLNYWGRIPKELESNGAKCFYGNHQSATSIKDSGEELAKRIKDIVNENHCEKVNIIAHSKGGLDCRYALANCGIEQYVASLTTINTPHRGCVFAEWLLKKAPNSLKEKIAATYNNAAKCLGDREPDFISAVSDLTSEVCLEFDKTTPLPKKIYTQSVGSVMKNAGSGKFPLNLSYDFVKYFDGKNDGLVGENSFRWGSKYVLLDLPVKRGISHADMIDLNRENIQGFDVREFYVELVEDLKKRNL